MKVRPICVKLALVACMAFAGSALHAQDGLEGALARESLSQPLRTNAVSLVEKRLAAADFDNDHKPDGVILLDSDSLPSRNSFRIELHLSASDNAELRFESADSALSIAAWDINHDGATDVIVEHAFTHRRLFVWLGDGRGGFRKGRVEDFPSTNALNGQEASPPAPRADRNVLSLPSQSRFEKTLLRVSHISGRPPSRQQFYSTLPTSPSSLRVVATLASRAPPFSQSL